MSPEERFEALTRDFRGVDGVTHGADGPTRAKVFGATALKTGGKIFAMLAQGRLVVKLPRDRVAELVESGAGVAFDPGQGRVMREWFSLDPETAMDWGVLAREALAFVGGKQ